MADVAKFIEEIKALSVLELNELVKAIDLENVLLSRNKTVSGVTPRLITDPEVQFLRDTALQSNK